MLKYRYILMKTNLTFLDRLTVQTQIFIVRSLMLVYGSFVVFLIRVVRGHRFDNVPEIRKQYKEYLKNGKPTLLCGNHITMVDSFLINQTVASVPFYFLNFRSYPWNVPAFENYKHSLFYRIMTYLGACIPINRQGTSEHHQKVQDKILYLLNKGYVVTMFPEGTRSRTGFIDPEKVSYGVGHILKDLEDPQVITVYCRGEKQKTYSNFPEKVDRIHISMDLINPVSDKKGMRAARDLAQQVIHRIKEMEDDYFDQHPDRKPSNYIRVGETLNEQ